MFNPLLHLTIWGKVMFKYEYFKKSGPFDKNYGFGLEFFKYWMFHTELTPVVQYISLVINLCLY